MPTGDKVEVSRKTLQSWSDQIWKAHGSICNDERDDACITLEQTIDNIKAASRNND